MHDDLQSSVSSSQSSIYSLETDVGRNLRPGYSVYSYK